MTDSAIIEILLGVLTLVVGYGSYLGASRAEKARANATQADVDADAYERARVIYESAINALEGNVRRLREQIDILDTEITELQRFNTELRSQVLDLQMANTRLESELNSLKGTNKS